MNRNSPVWIKNPDAKDTKEGTDELWLPTVIESKVGVTASFIAHLLI